MCLLWSEVSCLQVLRAVRGREGKQSKQINPWNIWPVLGIFTHEAPHLIKV